MKHGIYTYDNLGTKKGITYYRCARRGGNFCSGSLKKLADGTFITIKPHNGHQAHNPNEALVRALREVLKRRASSENLTLKHIYDEEARRNPEASSLYPYSTAESIMRLARRSSLPSLPHSLADLATIFDEGRLHRYSCCGEIMFKGCVQDVDGRACMIFSCTALLQLVLANNIDEVHVDATFKVVPSNMGSQLLTIHCMIDNYSIPIVYCLMECKTRNTYNCVFNFLKTNLLANLNPSIIITDYETALRDTLTFIFPTARITGCWFHHNQAVWRNMKKRGFLQLINTNEFASKALRMLFALPLLPSGDIQRAFDMVRMFAVNHGIPMSSLFDYYDNYWLRQVGSNIISVNGLPRRTNNSLESFHNTLRNKFNVTHPNLWIFLDHLSHLSMNFHTIMAQINNNLRPTSNHRINYRHLNSIQHACQQYTLGLISMWQFLQRMSHATTTYEQQQRNWALHVDNEPPIVVQPAAPIPGAADLVPVVALVPVGADLFPVIAPVPVAADSAEVVVPVPVAADSAEVVVPVPVAEDSAEVVVPVPVAADSAEVVVPVPVAADSAEVVVLVPVDADSAEVVAPVPVAADSAQVVAPVPVANLLPVIAPTDAAEILQLLEPVGHPYHLQDNGRHRNQTPRVDGRERNGRQFNIVQAFYAEVENEVEPQQENEILELCIICYSGITTTTVVPCQHHFCRVCIERWLREGRRGCPLCRTDIIMLQK
ncbi:unnamed protein product [Macrosiphum euphorbiae]|uniref:RING-type domain-containing protein n=1 Tax=Macrosiphum euphorbiae TaxID=13131 RepID=A0AAV0VT42_9HEMI|nr:unnamed protein product [Macrosiphum euphorbiae]